MAAESVMAGALSVMTGSGSWAGGGDLFKKRHYNPSCAPDDPLSGDLSFVGESRHEFLTLALLQNSPYHSAVM